MNHTDSDTSPGDSATPGKAAPAAIPVEVWQHIFHELDADKLWDIAALNAPPFSGWCNEILLCHNAPFVDTHDEAANSIKFDALHASLSAPLGRDITCRFKGPFGTKHLLRLRDIVVQSTELQGLHFEFRRPNYDDKAFVLALNNVIYAMSATTNGNVVAVELSLQSIRCLQMASKAKPGGLRKTYQTGPQQSSESFKQDGVMDWSPKSPAASVTLKCIDSSQSGSLAPFTVAVQNTLQGRTLKLGDIGQSDRTTLTGHQLSAILPHITLDRLNTLEIHTAEIDPSVLREFLSRHRALTHISYIRVTDAGQVTHSVTTPRLFRPTLQLTRAALFAFLDGIKVDANPPVDGGPNIVLEGIDKADLMKLLSNRVIYQSGT
ncbi:hypothetical protein C8R43DRAFT_1136410 [Mycena crocata]|nr:hypothetical protein C8R43DRAFT_1136410 [Mycena crocata]